MRSKSLIKKIGAAFLAVVILASMGFTTFAAQVGSEAAGEDLVSAIVQVTELSEGYGFYNVAVTYTNNSDSVLGVTMLAYAETADDGKLGSSDISTGYTEEMQIVGIDQTEVVTSGTFNFLVNTNPDTTGSGAIRMNKGDVGIVLLSADGAVAPTGYLFAIPEAKEFIATKAELSEPDVTITVPYGTAADELELILAELKVTVSDDGDNSEGNWTADWDVTGYDGNVAGPYTAIGTPVKPAGSSVTLADGVTVTVTVTVEAGGGEEPEVFVAASAEAVDANGAVVTSIEVENGTSETDAKAKLPTAAKLYNEGKSESMDWTIASWTIAGYNATTAGDYKATATLEAPADSTVDISGVAPITVTVKVKAAAPPSSEYARGDVNGDKSLNIKDVNTLAAVLVGKAAYSSYDAADVNKDGSVNIKDVNNLAAALVGKFTIPN